MTSLVLEKLRTFAMQENIYNHRFCLSGMSKFDSLEVLTDLGICYAFNSGFALFDQRTFVALRSIFYILSKSYLFAEFQKILSVIEPSHLNAMKV